MGAQLFEPKPLNDGNAFFLRFVVLRMPSDVFQMILFSVNVATLLIPQQANTFSDLCAAVNVGAVGVEGVGLLGGC